MLFKYLRKATPTDFLTSKDIFHYFDYGFLWMGWQTPTKCSFFYYILSIFVYFWCNCYIPIGIIISFLMEMENFNTSDLLSVLQLLFNSFGTPIKIVFIRMQIRRFHNARELLSKMDNRCTSISEKYEVHRWVVNCNKAYLIYECIYVVYTIFTFLSTVFSGVLPWGIYNPFIDWRESRTNFWIAALHELFIMIFAVSNTVLTDIYTLIFGFMLRVHIRLLRIRVEKLCTSPDKSDKENLEDLINCIEDHKLIKECAQTIRPIISRTIFVQFLLIGASLGFSMINLFLFADFWTGLATVAYINGLITQTFPFCFVCDLIKWDCELLEVAIFHSNWLDKSQTYKSTLRFFLKNAQKSVVFSAGAVFPISISTNIQVAKLAFSVFTLVNQLYTGDRMN
ncbi:odorant receptor 98a [Drosophila ficusphila]|uniref:odorant receptor 98a n=1 Tax=Drosophila ficusphila TaxID=30025 RepID=UPI0007E87C77|nr:odorant receptor 98a [Drosophila ficusphila]